MEKHKLVIIGAGIAGLCIAIGLRKAGVEAVVFDSAPSWEPLGAGLALSANAMKALRVLCLEQEVADKGQPLDAFFILDTKGRKLSGADESILNQPYGAEGITIHRHQLHQLLEARLSAGQVRLGKKAERFEQKADGVKIYFEDGTCVSAGHVIAAEGIDSLFRQTLLPGTAPRFAGYTCWRAVVDAAGLNIPRHSETWGKAGRFGIAPLGGDSVYWFACINAAPADERLKAFTPADLLKHFGDYHAPIPELLKRTPADKLIWTDICDVKPIGRFAFGNILLTGDAAHATTPNLGQGACQAIEDAAVLAAIVYRQPDLRTAFLEFEKQRLSRTRWIVNRSHALGRIAQLENPLLIRMRNLVMRWLPAAFQRRQFRKIYGVDFAPVRG